MDNEAFADAQVANGMVLALIEMLIARWVMTRRDAAAAAYRAAKIMVEVIPEDRPYREMVRARLTELATSFE